MFAGSIQSIVCHVVDEEGKTTVCGLKVSTYVNSRRSIGRLHILTSKPPDCRVCKHCSRLSEERSRFTGRTDSELSSIAAVNRRFGNHFDGGAGRPAEKSSLVDNLR
jgi:hypothetical protein